MEQNTKCGNRRVRTDQFARKGADSQAAELAAIRLYALDRALADLVLNCDCLTLLAKDHLAAMQRRVRSMRIQVEVEGGLPALAGPTQPDHHLPCFSTFGKEDIGRHRHG